MNEVLLRARWLTAIAVLFSLGGATLMFVAGAVTTARSVGIYLGSDQTAAATAFSDEAALRATVQLVSSIDQFLLALVLLIFGYGVYRLFLSSADGLSPADDDPDWLSIRSVTDLKIKLLETITLLLAVLFLKSALDVGKGPIEWSALVIPVSVGVFAAAIWLIRRAR